jgi:hypothetical protein
MNDELKKILYSSLMGAIGFMWVVGGIAVILSGFDMHWSLGWLALFVWVWGCTAGALYFDVKRFLNY